MNKLGIILGLVVVLLGAAVQAWAVEADPISPGSWTMILLPDTQHYVDDAGRAAIFDMQTQWIADHQASHNIKMVIHQGDITNNNNATQFTYAKHSMDILSAAGVPYSMAPGNHDYGPSGNCSTRDSLFNSDAYFGPNSAYAAQGNITFFESGRTDNSYSTFNAGGKDWLVFSAEFGPRDQVVTWMNDVATAHPGYNFILNTHAYMYYDDTRYDWAAYGASQTWNPHNYGVASLPGGVNDGEELWNGLVKNYENWKFTFNGHVLEDGAGRLSSVGTNKNVVHQMLANYQMRTDGGDGYMRIVEFMADGDTVKVSTYSPYSGAYFPYLTSYDQGFTLKMSEPMAPVPVIRGVCGASLDVANGSTNATSVWSVPGTGPSTVELLSEPNIADVSVMIDKVPAYRQQGVMMATVRQNVRNDFYGTVEVSQVNLFSGLDVDVLQVATSRAYNSGEYNMNVAIAMFPFADGWISGHVGAGAVLGEHYGITSSNVATGSDNRFVLTIDNIDSQDDGMLFAVGGYNGHHFLSTAPMADGSWEIAVRNDNASTFDDIENSPWSFVYVDYSAPGLIGGHISASGSTLAGAGSFSVSRENLGAGEYRITIGGGQYTPDEGVLLLTVAQTETESITAPADNIISYEADGNTFLVNIRDRNGAASDLQDCAFVFAFVPYDGYLAPAVPGDANYDGQVDQDDAGVLSSHWGNAGATWADGDFNLDGLVNAADAAILTANWGYGTSEATTVPEPSALVLTAGLFAATLFLRKRHG